VSVTAPNVAPTAGFTSGCIDLDCGFTDASTDSDGTLVSWNWDFGDGNGSSDQNPNHSYASAGDYTVSLTVTDDDGASDSTSNLVSVSEPPAAGFRMYTGVVNNVDSSGWTNVVLPESFTSMVVVATVNYGNTDLPAVTRIQNASGNSFDVRLANPGGGAVGPHAVHYLAVEEGVYTQAADGITLEAVKYNSTVTAFKNGWTPEPRSYQNSYSNPVVIGQVMSYNDANWSVFWAQGSSRTNPPSATSLAVGKHVAEDTNITRADEMVGYIVFEAGSGTVNGIEYSAGLGSDIVRGPTNSPPFNYSFNGVGAPTSSVVSTAALDGGDGGWPILYGTNPVSAGNLALMYDEDQIANSERSHTTEQVAYVVFGVAGDNLPPAAGFTQSCTDLDCGFTDASSDGDGNVVSWSWDFGDGNGSSAQNPDHSYSSAGSYTVTLTVTDDDGATDNASTLVTVAAANSAPTADFTYGCTDLNCGFTDTSTDSDGSVVSWSWDFGDGNGSSAQNPDHGYSSAGSYTVTLVVTDNNGASDNVSALVTVTEPPAGWTELVFDDFESGWGNWIDGGNDSRLVSQNAIGFQNVDLRDDSSTSHIQLADSLDLGGYTQLQIEFSYVASSFENSEDFWVRISSDGGSSWQTVQAFVNNVDFVDNGTRYDPVIVIDSGSYTFNNNVKIRFQCDASGNNDHVYIDNIRISAQ
ncbi:MAG TPA: PKD domain-containing protein, partial [Xanthomonadales bacterium]|nr:PKD domain-containing protein [Xanthomonadales bacterium]